MSMICCLREAGKTQLDQLLSDPESILTLLKEEMDEVDLDKAWHGIHFLLTGSAWDGEEPLCYLVKGGKEVGDVDVGYGPARVLNPKQVADWAFALSAVSAAELRDRFDPQAMLREKIYPEIWEHDPEEDDPLSYLLEYFDVLRSFVEQARGQAKGAIVYIA